MKELQKFISILKEDITWQMDVAYDITSKDDSFDPADDYEIYCILQKLEEEAANNTSLEEMMAASCEVAFELANQKIRDELTYWLHHCPIAYQLCEEVVADFRLQEITFDCIIRFAHARWLKYVIEEVIFAINRFIKEG
jgi:hypothetical protein